MSTAILKSALKRAKAVFDARPKSLLEWYEFTRDEVVLTPRFQYVGRIICYGCLMRMSNICFTGSLVVQLLVSLVQNRHYVIESVDDLDDVVLHYIYITLLKILRSK